MAILSTEVSDGIATLTLDVPGESVNTFGPSAIAEVTAALDRIAADPAARAVIVRSGKPDSFIAGADINQFLLFQTPEDGEAASRAGHAFLAKVAAFPKPTVVAIHGACLGLGLELALACDYRVASDDPKTQLGLPEIQLGVIPGAGGCNRLPRLIGLRAALDIILAGKSERSAKALRLGMVDEVVPASILEAVARKAADRLAGDRRSTRRRGGITRWLLDGNWLGRQFVYRAARRAVVARTRGHYPAPLEAIEVVRTGLERGMEEGLRAEARAFGRLAISPVSRQLVGLFFATTALKKDDGIEGTATADPVRRIGPIRRLGILGAGFMGSGIAGTAITTAKVEVRLKDAELARVGKGIRAALETPKGQLTRKRITRFEYQRLAALVSGAADYRGLESADLIIEAVFEDLEVKRQVLAEVEAAIRPDALFASNTSTIPIARIAAGARHPERVLGMHFFSPVDRMPLLEVIPGSATGPDAVATAVRFGRALGKTVIVVADRPGFWVNRILSPYLVEAGHLLGEGIPIEVIDAVMVRWGFPVGPMTLLDEVGIDVAAKGGGVMVEAFGERLAPSPAIAEMVAAKRLGRKAGAGFYRYHGGQKGEADPDVYRLLGVTPLAQPDRQAIERRLVYALLNEAARAHGEGVVRRARDGDVGAVFGIGFPPFRGGPLRLIDALGGEAVVSTLEELARAYGSRFAPGEALRERRGEPYYRGIADG
jgi:3-hydroxyacyl-CoA dehydrogenase/enoyl-CoA hydratase/3-hydroxybutyryl-CoA epimerase